MEDIIKDEFFGEVKYKPNIGSWVGITDAPLYNSEGNLKLVVQDLEKEGILDVQREAYKTYLQNADKYKEIAVDYLLDYYKWNYEYIASEVSGVTEKDHKDVVTETQLFEFMTLWYLFICRDGSFGYAFGCCWDVDNGLAVLLSEEEPRVISRTQLKNLHKINDDTFGLLVHDGKENWKGLEYVTFSGKKENLEIELSGSVEEGITEAQQKAYVTYQQQKDAYFMQLTEVLLAANAESSQTIQPKTLYIDREGNMGWICYTNWDASYLGVLFTGENILLVTDDQLKDMGEYKITEDKTCGKLLIDDSFAGRIEIRSFLGKIQTLYLDFQLEDGKLTREQRNAYKKYLNRNPKFWENIKDVMLDYYLSIYEDMVEFIDVPEGLEIENVTRDNVLNIVDFGRIYFTYDGRGCFLGECPIGEEEGIGFEFTDGEIEIIDPIEIL